MANEHILGFDPSINNFGWAILRLQKGRNPRLIDSGILHPPERYIRNNKTEGERRIPFLATHFDAMITHWEKRRGLKFRYAAFEKPHYEKKKGLLKLVTAAGAILGILALHRIPVALITASQWKRDRPDGEIRDDMEEVYPAKRGKWVGLDELMAVGVATWALEREQHGKLVITKP